MGEGNGAGAEDDRSVSHPAQHRFRAHRGSSLGGREGCPDPFLGDGTRRDADARDGRLQVTPRKDGRAQARRLSHHADGPREAPRAGRPGAAHFPHRGHQGQAHHARSEGRSAAAREMKLRTRLAQRGRAPKSRPGTVNLPVARASTVTFATLAELEATQSRFDADEIVPTYGILNMPVRAGFEELMGEIEGGHRAVTLPSGLAAVAIALMACAESGDHVLVTNSAYGPARRFCQRTLARYGVEATFYDPCIGAAIADLMRPN